MQGDIKGRNGPSVRCIPVRVNGSASWDDISAAFRGAEGLSLRQAWRDTPQTEFRPASVRVGWDAARLLIYAELQDDDIFNPVVVFNEPAFMQGDVFEMFLRPAGQESYYEFHVTPGNQRFQLRFPSEEAFRAPKPAPGIPADWFLNHRQIESRVTVDATQKTWRVLAGVPFDWVCENERPHAGSEWLFSFSRYDYTRGQSSPVLSSTSAHAKVDFHRQCEWGRLVFDERP
jgi:hypothetical protein